jgi:hypothetical protein
MAWKVGHMVWCKTESNRKEIQQSNLPGLDMQSWLCLDAVQLKLLQMVGKNIMLLPHPIFPYLTKI